MIGERLKIALAIRGIKQNQLAKKIGVTAVTIHRYIIDERCPDGETIIKICKELNISADWLLGLMGD